jgi:hypothetical protein
MKKVAVLCRGKSLESLNSLPDVDAYVIANNWGSELTQQFIIDRLSDNKPIINILSLAIWNTPGVEFDELVKIYKNFNIQKIVLPYVKECVTGGEQSYFDIEGRDGIIRSEPLPDIVKPFMWKGGADDCPDGCQQKYEYDVPTTGIAGVLYAAAVLDADEIHICGMDFYEETYAFQTEREKVRNEVDSKGIVKVSKPEIKPMKTFLTEKIINKFPDKKFYINTYGNYNPNGDNVMINNLNKKKIAVIVSGWHYPLHFYEQIKNQKIPDGWEVDLFCVSHRSPDLELIRTETSEYISTLGDTFLNRLDKFMYSKIATVEEIERLGFEYVEEPNTMGDWESVNQWLDKHNYKDYDFFLTTHDDNFIVGDNIFTDAVLQFDYNDWLVISNSKSHNPRQKNYTGRASFDFFKKELLELLGGKFDVGMEERLQRVGKIDNPKDPSALKNWNGQLDNFIEFIKNNELNDKMRTLSDVYRVSNFCIEGERGFLSAGGGQEVLVMNNFLNNNFNIKEV